VSVPVFPSKNWNSKNIKAKFATIAEINKLTVEGKILPSFLATGGCIATEARKDKLSVRYLLYSSYIRKGPAVQLLFNREDWDIEVRG